MIQNKITNDESKMKDRVIFFLTYIVFIGGSLVLIFIGGSLALKLVPSIGETYILATSVKPETFTELYFEDHLSLPTDIEINKEITFKFTIHNLENKDMMYKYEVYLDGDDGKKTIDQNVILVKNNEYQKISETFSFEELIQNRVKVVVNLINENQQIHFWMIRE